MKDDDIDHIKAFEELLERVWIGKFKKEGFIPVPIGAFELLKQLGLDHNGACVAIALVTVRNGREPVTVSTKLLAKHLGLSVKAVQRAISLLCKLGLVRVMRRANGSKPTKYELINLLKKIYELSLDRSRVVAPPWDDDEDDEELDW